MTASHSSSTNAVHEIDPTLMTPEDQVMLGYFLDKYRTNGQTCFDAKTERDFPPLDPNHPLAEKLSKIKPYPVRICLKYKLIWRLRNSDPGEYRYDVYSGKIIGGISLGNGCFGNVEEIIGTVAPLDDASVVYKGDKHRVGKIQKADRLLIAKEGTLMSRVAQLRAKLPTFFSNEVDALSAIVMRLINGEDLDKFYKKDFVEKLKNTSSMSTDKRLELSIAILLALKKQVHANKIVHRDFKLANIIADIGEFIDIVIIDYGLSLDSEDNDNKSVGTPLYAPPEYYDSKQLTKESDVYGMAWVLALLWRSKDNPSTTFSNASNFAHHCVFSGLCDGIEIDQKHKTRIEQMLNLMAKVKPQDRCTLDYAIDVFESILLERKIVALKKTSALHLKDSFSEAFLIGSAVRKRLDALSEKHSINFTFGLDQFKTIFQDAITKVRDDPLIITEFVNRLDVVALRGLKSRQAIMDKIELLTNGYLTNFTRLTATYTEINLYLMGEEGVDLKRKSVNELPEQTKLKTALQRMANKIELLLAKNNGRLSLDMLARINHQMGKGVLMIDSELKRLQSTGLLKIVTPPTHPEAEYLFVYGPVWKRPHYLTIFKEYPPIKSEMNHVLTRSDEFSSLSKKN